MRCWISLLLASGVATGCLDPETGGNLVPATVDEDATLPALELNGTRLRVETYGNPDDNCVVMLHGGPGGDLDPYRRNAPVWAAAGHHVVLWDQRGAGLSRRHDADAFTLDVLVEDLDAVIDAVCRPERAVDLVGHSWGGMYATLYTARHPARVNTVILAEPGPIDSERFEAMMQRLQPTAPFGTAISEHELHAAAIPPAGHARLDFLALHYLMHGGIEGYFLSEDDPMPVARLGAVTAAASQALAFNDDGEPDYDLADGIEAHSGTIVVVRSAWNTVLDLDHHERTAERVGARALLTIEDVGHDLTWAAADAFNSIVLAHLST